MVNKPGVQVSEGGGHVDREVVPLEAVLLSDAHGDCRRCVCPLRTIGGHAARAHYGSTLGEILKMMGERTEVEKNVGSLGSDMSKKVRARLCDPALLLPLAMAASSHNLASVLLEVDNMRIFRGLSSKKSPQLLCR